LTNPADTGVTFDLTEVAGDLPDHPDLRIDKNLFDRIISNLVDNAQKYSTPGSVVTIGSEFGMNFLLFRIRNSGIVLREEDVSKAVEKGWRSQEAGWVTGEGSGMGLWIVSEILGQCGGKLALIPTDERGITEVCIWIQYC
jgi:two-component system phosphate regulon sensor histidine kinase PhoR